MKPLVSVIVPSYMEENNIEACLNSICSQTYQNIEIICVDDNSTDRTFEIITDCQKSDPRIQAFKNPGKGVSCARNLGIKMASGEWIVFADSDDYLQPQMIEFLLDATQAFSSEIAVCSYERKEKFEVEFFEKNCNLCSPEQIFLKNEMDFASACAKIFSKQIIGDTRFEGLTIGEDTVFCAKIWKKYGSKEVAYVNLPMYHYTQNSNSTLSNPNAERRKDMVLSRLRTSEILTELLPSVSFYYLEQALLYVAAYRRKKYSFNRDIKLCFRRIFLKHYMTYFFCRKSSVPNKVYIAVSYLLPTLAVKIYNK